VARRVVIDPRLELPAEGQLVATAGEAPLTVAASEAVLQGEADERRRTLEEAGVEVLGLETREADGMLDLRRLMRHLAQAHGATNVLCEGGGRTIGTLIEQELTDELLVFVAPKLLGDPRHVAPVAWSGRSEGTGQRIDEAQELHLLESRKLGEDVLLRYRVPSRL
jgi:diaminohydroxyphosphoribosylaminopyrimidine deaminase/5-amino-6-(5-phosphoribosylamino)uracil reductase